MRRILALSVLLLAGLAVRPCDAQPKKKVPVKRVDFSKLQTVDFSKLQLSDLVSGRYKDASPAEKYLLLTNLPDRYPIRSDVRLPRAPITGRLPVSQKQKVGTADNGLKYYISNQTIHLPSASTGATESEGADDNYVVCHTTPMTLIKRFAGPLWLDASVSPNQSVIHPGALFKDGDIVRGLFTPLSLPRKPGSFVIDVQNNGGSISQPVTNMNDKTQVAQAINALRSQTSGAAVNTYLDYLAMEYQAGAQLNLEYEASMDANLTEVVGFPLVVGSGQEAGVSVENSLNVAVAVLHQIYYTISLGGEGPASTITPPVPADAVCVTDVQYGRLAFLALGSFTSRAEASLALHSLINVGLNEDLSAAQAEQNLSAGAQAALSADLVKIKIVGGDAAQAVTVHDVASFRHYVEQIDPTVGGAGAAPISYALRYASDNSLVKVGAVAEFEDRECWRANVLKATLKTIKPTKVVDFGHEELYGSITVDSIGTTASGSRTLWSHARSAPVDGKENVALSVNENVTFNINPAVHSPSQVGVTVNLKDKIMADEWLGASDEAKEDGYVKYSPGSFSVGLNEIRNTPNGKLSKTFAVHEGNARVEIAMTFELLLQ